MQSELNSTETSSSNSDTLPSVPEVKVELGSILASARESQNLNVEDVAASLRLSVAKINALEADDFLAISDPTLARGFIRIYARLLKLDPEPLLMAHRYFIPAEIVNPIGVKTEIVSAPLQPTNFKRNSAVLGLVLLIIALVWFFSYHNKSDSDVAEVNVSTVIQDALPQQSMPVAEREVESNEQVTELALPKEASTSNSEPSKALEKTANEPTKIEPLKKVSVGESLVRVKLLFTGNSWVSVKDKNGNTLYDKTAKAGGEEYVEGIPPLKFHIGNVSATQIVFNGETIDLSPNTYNNTARLTLGAD
jgi:cytoskeleton protein RodZ